MAIDLKYNDYISLYTNISFSPSTFLVDTQADISIFKASSIPAEFQISSNEIINIKGITNETIESLGTAIIDLNLNDGIISHKFHVVPDEFNLKTDGIIGIDFLTQNKCVINFETRTFTVNKSKHVSVFTITQGPDEKSLLVPARCETIQKFIVESNEACVIHNHEILPGVHIS